MNTHTVKFAAPLRGNSIQRTAWTAYLSVLMINLLSSSKLMTVHYFSIHNCSKQFWWSSLLPPDSQLRCFLSEERGILRIIQYLNSWLSDLLQSKLKKDKKLIRRWDSERELSLRRHCTRTRKCNRLLHKFRHRSFSAMQVYQIQWYNAM